MTACDMQVYSKERIHPSLSFCSVLCYTTAPLLQATGTFSKILNPQKQSRLVEKEKRVGYSNSAQLQTSTCDFFQYECYIKFY